MSFNINDFRSHGLIYGGTRPSQFEVTLFPQPPLPFSSASTPRFKFFVQAATLPAFMVGQAPIPYFGAVIKYSGERQYGDWNVSVINDEDFAVRAMLEKWSNMMNTLISNRLDPSAWPTGYKSTAEVTQFGKDGKRIRSYLFSGLFPTMIDQIDLNWGDTNRIETFNVTFSLDYFEPSNQGFAPDTYNALLGDEANISGQQGVPNSLAPGASPRA